MTFLMNSTGPSSSGPSVAYLAPEIPALSATFVYEEILGLERIGVRVVPFSVHRPSSLALGQDDLASRVSVLYNNDAIGNFVQNILLLPSFGQKALTALGALGSDLRENGLGKVASWKLIYQFLTGVRLAKYLRETGCQHLHIHFAHVPTQIGMYASMLSGIPFTVTAHANDIFERGMLLKRKAERAKRFLTISDYNVRYLVSQGIPAEQLAVIRCGVSLAADAVPRRSASESETLRIGSLGRLVEKKGFDVLIEAVAILKERGLKVELRIAGDGPLKAELAQRVAKFGVANITVFEGSLPHSQVAAWMMGLDVFALACKQDQAGDMDGIPVVLMEAMSQSLPVVSTRISGIPELILHNQTGLLANPNDANDLANQIGSIVESPSMATARASRAFDYVKGEFSQSVNLDRLLGYFDLANKNSTQEK